MVNKMEKKILNKEKIIKVIFDALDEINLLLPKNQHLKKSTSVILSGPAAKLDSLGFINLIVAIEQKIEKELGMSIALADELGIFNKKNPFRNINTLIDYITLLLEERSNDQ